MRWITLFAMVASFAVVSSAAEYGYGNAAPPAPAKEAAPAAPAKAPGTDSEPQLEGVVVERENGFMTVTMDGPHMVLRFFDAQKKPIAPDVDRAIVKFRMSARRPENRTLVLGADGMSLTGGRALRPPFVFKAFISLVKNTGDATVDNYDENAELPEGEHHEVDYP